MATIANLMVKIAADQSGLNAAMTSMDNKTAAVMSNIAKVAAGATAAVVAASAKLGQSAISEFAEFESGMNEVFTLLPGITDNAMSQMEDSVKSFALEFGVLPKETIPALYQAISAGVPQDNVFSFLETAQMAAKGGVTELKTAVDGITSVINAYGPSVLSATEASDLMFTAVKLGKTDFEQLSASLYNVIPTASSLGIEFGDITAALATMTAQGVPTAQSTTQLRQLLVELSKSGNGAAETFTQLSGQTFSEFITSGGNVADALSIMEQAAISQGLSISDMFSSVEAGNAALSLSGKNMDSYVNNINAMADAAGATEAAFEQMNQGITSATDKLKSTFSTAMIDVGDALSVNVQDKLDYLLSWSQTNLPEIESIIISATQPVINIILALATGITNLIDWFNKYEAILKPLAVAIGAATLAFAAYRLSILAQSAAVKGAALVQSAFSATMYSSTIPIWAVIAAVGALAAIAYVVVKNWEPVVDFFDAAWTLIKAAFDTGVSGALVGVNALKLGLAKLLNFMLDDMLSGVSDFLSAFSGIPYIGELFKKAQSGVDSLRRTINNFADDAQSDYTASVQAARAAAENTGAAWDKLSAAASALGSSIAGTVAETVQNVKDKVWMVSDAATAEIPAATIAGDALGNALGDGLASGVIDGAASAVSTAQAATDTISNMAVEASTALSNAVDSALSGGVYEIQTWGGMTTSTGLIGESDVASEMAGVLSRNPDVDLGVARSMALYNLSTGIEQYAKGTNYVPSDGLAYLHQGEAVIPAEYNNGGGASINITITGNTISNQYDINRIGDDLVAHLRRKGVRVFA